MLDPGARWEGIGSFKPEYAGLSTFAGLPYTEDPAELTGARAVIVGAPFDSLVTDQPGARNGPRAIRAAGLAAGPGVDHGVDALSDLGVVDFGDAAVRPHDPEGSHAAIEELVGTVLDAGAIPLVLGGDHSITEPEVRACAERHGPLGLIHFDTHTDTAEELYGKKLSHGTVMRTLVDGGLVDGNRYAQIGLRGYWPEEEEFAWQRERGIVHFTMGDILRDGLAPVLVAAVAAVGEGPAFVTVDVDVLDPAVAPGTGTPEPGGLSARELLYACREVASNLDVVGADVVEVAPIGPRDVTALIADRIVRELLTGIAMRRDPKPAAAE